MIAKLESIQLLAYQVITQVPVPGPAVAPPELQAKGTAVLGFILWGVMLLAVVGVLVCAGTMVVAHRRGSWDEHGAKLGALILGCVLAGAASGVVSFLML